jgi:FkbM family methyltransferase
VNRTPALSRLVWIARHPVKSLGLLGGYSLRDLILRTDLERIGRPLSTEMARGIGRSNLSVATVGRLVERFRGREPRTLLDAGASHGEFAAAAGIAFPGLLIHAFEPLPVVFTDLSSVLARFPGATAHRVALGDGDGEAEIHVSENTGSSSLLPIGKEHERAFPGTGEVGREAVRLATLDSMVEEHGLLLEPPVLLKVDVQGYEDRLLRGARRTLARTDFLIVEMSLAPLFPGQSLAGEVTEGIEAAGFTREGDFAEIASPATGEVLQVDGLFSRTRPRSRGQLGSACSGGDRESR